MKTKTINEWELTFIDYLSKEDTDDASHDLGHFKRVYQTAKSIIAYENEAVDLLVVLAAAYFHDIVSLPKDLPDNKKSSYLASIKAKEILIKMDFPKEKIKPVCHAILTHSFSANIPPETLEAKIIQDADRMEALGALGIMRTFYVSGRLQRSPFDPKDLFAENRNLDDKLFGLDHFYLKLFKLPNLLQTKGGKLIAKERTDFMKSFIKELEHDIKQDEGGALFLTMSCYQAGLRKLQLFDSLDPFAKDRKLDPAFVIDKLIAKSKNFPIYIEKFLSQFHLEIDSSIA
ncbi:MAG: hypothetical protein S4CHLAM20_10880 [Chlamydiia bacterium]|nr:hypothetical protein [Chlamydiia bacterium]